jgi:cyclopropane fatty-acyl-phospholipid synthase-like methyltransferase
MLSFLLYVLVWILIVILFISLILFLIMMISGFRARVPFVPVPNSILKDIFKALDIKDDSVVYDLGCGEGRVLFYAARLVPKATYIGIENSTFPLILAHARAWWHRKAAGKNIEIINEDFFNHDLSNSTHIFTYLYPEVMDDLLPKFDKELKKGTRLVSVTFKFTARQPTYEVDLKRKKYQLAQKIYVYEF